MIHVCSVKENINVFVKKFIYSREKYILVWLHVDFKIFFENLLFFTQLVCST